MFHCQIQADCFVELKQQIEKNTAATQHLLERVGSLETRLNAVEELQDAEQRVQLLGDQQERDSDGDQRTKINALVLLQGAEYTVLTELCKHCGKEILPHEMQVGYYIKIFRLQLYTFSTGKFALNNYYL